MKIRGRKKVIARLNERRARFDRTTPKDVPKGSYHRPGSQNPKKGA